MARGEAYPAGGQWMSVMPKERRAGTGVIIRKVFVSFALSESGRQASPTPGDVRAWRKMYPYGVGGPPPRSVPAGDLRLEIHSRPWVTTRRRFRDTAIDHSAIPPAPPFYSEIRTVARPAARARPERGATAAAAADPVLQNRRTAVRARTALGDP